MTKSIEEWFLSLKRPVRAKAIKNYKANPLSKSQYKSLYYALAMSFGFRDSPEGYDYWRGVVTNIEKHGKQSKYVRKGFPVGDITKDQKHGLKILEKPKV